MAIKTIYLFILLISLWITGCSTLHSGNSYLAKVNQDLITSEDLKDEFQYRHGGHMKFLEGEVEQQKFLASMIDQRLLLQEAYRIGIQDDPGIVLETEKFENQKIKEHLLKTEVDDLSKATDNEIKNIYERRIGEYLQVQQIVVKTREEAEAILKGIRSGEEFETIAREKSIAPSSKFGGRIFPVVWGSMDADWERIVFDLSPGETAPVFKSGMGYEIVRLEERKVAEEAGNTDNTVKTDKPVKPEFSRVEKRIRSVLEHRKAKERKEELVRSLREKYAVKFIPMDLGVEELKKGEKTKSDARLAAWNGGSITLSSFASMLDFDRLSSLPREEVGDKIRGLLGDVVDEKIFQAEGRSRGYDNVPEIARKVRQHRERRMLRNLYENYILADVTVGETDFKEYFEGHRKEFTFPEKRKIAHVLIDSLDTAKEVLKRSRQGEPFDNLARTYSKDKSTAERGGDIGWIDKDKVSPIFKEIFSTLKAGEIGDPVRSEQGYHIVKILEIQPETLKDYSQAREEIEKRVIKRKRDERVRFWVDKLKAVSQIEIRGKR
jgi:parvulin-like peptidyl-prolyl isomerase